MKAWLSRRAIRSPRALSRRPLPDTRRGLQLIAELAVPAAGSRVLDLCASPGGKTVRFAADVGDSVRSSPAMSARIESAS